MPKITKKQDLINNIAKIWLNQYAPEYPAWKYFERDHAEEIYNKLLALENPTEDSIAEIIGNRSWTLLMCDQCKQDVPEAYDFFRGFHHVPSFVRICWKCLSQAYEEMKEHADHDHGSN